MRRAFAILIAVILLLAGCGTPVTPKQGVLPASDGPHSDYDVMFLQMMISHQEQGLEMLELGRTKAVREDVVNLAGAIDVTEAEEVQTMRTWLSSWNVPVVTVSDPGNHAAHGAQPATGPAELKALQDATGTDFELKFLNLLIAHQHNAVEMAQQQALNGQNAAVKKLAERIELSRTQQIKQMLALVSG